MISCQVEIAAVFLWLTSFSCFPSCWSKGEIVVSLSLMKNLVFVVSLLWSCCCDIFPPQDWPVNLCAWCKAGSVDLKEDNQVRKIVNWCQKCELCCNLNRDQYGATVCSAGCATTWCQLSATAVWWEVMSTYENDPTSVLIRLNCLLFCVTSAGLFWSTDVLTFI